jgi:spore coat protein CotH
MLRYRLAAKLMIGRVIFGLVLLLGCARGLAAGSKAATAGADFFTNGALHSFEIQLSTQNHQALRGKPREYVSATVRANGLTYSNVGVHLKGVATFRPIDDEPSLTLNFSKYLREQRFHGLRKIHLNNGKEDPTLLCEALSAEAFETAGLPTARVTHGRVRLQGRDLGPYVVIEGFTPEFLSRYFKKTEGNLYDGGFRLEITNALERLLGQGPDNWMDLKSLAAAALNPDLEKRWLELSARLDTNSFARSLAMQVLISNWDGYALYRNNYRVYHDPQSDRLHFIAHGMDQTFSRPTAPILPRHWDGLVAQSFMETYQGRELYLKQLKVLFTKTYDVPALTRHTDEMSALLRPLIAERGEDALATYDRSVALLRARIQRRGQFLERQLSNR